MNKINLRAGFILLICPFFIFSECDPSTEASKIIDANSESTTVITSNIISPSCLLSSATTTIFNIKDDNAVLRLISNSNLNDPDNLFSLEVFLFDEEESDKQINWFVNNLYSDGLIANVAEPISRFTIPNTSIELKSKSTNEIISDCDRNRYNETALQLEVLKYADYEEFLLIGFEHEVKVYEKIIE